MSTAYCRANPSPRYVELLGQYCRMHVHGEWQSNRGPKQTFSGEHMLRHNDTIKRLIERFAARTILDYGSGKGQQYTSVAVKMADGRRFENIPAFWGIDAIYCYDPGYEPFRQLPAFPCDGVICTDVLEHCPQDDMPWIVEELFAHARKFVFANVACFAALKRLPNGENAHCTIQPHAWWRELFGAIAARHPHVRYLLTTERVESSFDGSHTVITEPCEG